MNSYIKVSFQTDQIGLKVDKMEKKIKHCLTSSKNDFLLNKISPTISDDKLKFKTHYNFTIIHDISMLAQYAREIMIQMEYIRLYFPLYIPKCVYIVTLRNDKWIRWNGKQSYTLMWSHLQEHL